MREAEMLGIPCVNGLDMLVVQALEAEKIWLSNDLTLDMESLGSKIKLQIK
jgi:shikimate 5-dehydrogenase